MRGHRPRPLSGAAVTKSEQNQRTRATGKGLLYGEPHLSRLSGPARPAFPLEGPRGSVESVPKGVRAGRVLVPRRSRARAACPPFVFCSAPFHVRPPLGILPLS